jgi:hypothetical protein
MKRPVRRTQYENGKSYSVDRSTWGKRQQPLGAHGSRTSGLGRVTWRCGCSGPLARGPYAMQGVEGTAALVSRAENSIENTGYLIRDPIRQGGTWYCYPRPSPQRFLRGTSSRAAIRADAPLRCWFAERTPFSKRGPDKLNQAAGLVLTPSTLASSRWIGVADLGEASAGRIETQAALADFQSATHRCETESSATTTCQFDAP